MDLQGSVRSGLWNSGGPQPQSAEAELSVFSNSYAGELEAENRRLREENKVLRWCVMHESGRTHDYSPDGCSGCELIRKALNGESL